MDEQELAGGNAGGQVVRVGQTVRKAWTASTASVLAFMKHVRDAGVDVPEALGQDEQGRQITEFIPGRLAMDSDPLTTDELCRVGRLIRDIHDASASFVPSRHAIWETAIPAPSDELVCHNDLAPWNLMVGERWVFIDWDAAAPSTRLWDLAYAAQAFTLHDVQQPPAAAAQNLAAFVDGYDADPSLRAELPLTMHRRASAMLYLLRSSHEVGHEPWASMYETFHRPHWEGVVRYVGAHQLVWAEALADRHA
ncbi:MAG: phosphotransferase [Tessaracoccus sp.]